MQTQPEHHLGSARGTVSLAEDSISLVNNCSWSGQGVVVLCRATWTELKVYRLTVWPTGIHRNTGLNLILNWICVRWGKKKHILSISVLRKMVDSMKQHAGWMFLRLILDMRARPGWGKEGWRRQGLGRRWFACNSSYDGVPRTCQAVYTGAKIELNLPERSYKWLICIW